MATRQPEEKSRINRIVRKTPWWGISGGLHTLGVLAISFLVVLHEPAASETAVIIAPPSKRRPQPEWERPKDPHPAERALEGPPVTVDPLTVEETDREPLESADEDYHQQRKGDSLDHVSDKPFKGKMSHDVVAPAGGGGGRYGSRLGGKREALRRGGGNAQTEGAVLAALRWLARHQGPDGYWKASGYADECGKFAKYPGKCHPNPGCSDHGVTGLALLAFLGAGYSHLSRDTYDGICFGDVVLRGLKWIIKGMRTDGQIDNGYTYSHSICSLALCEAYGLTGSSLFAAPADRSIGFLLSCQNDGKAWRYGYQSKDNDTSNTGFAVMALKSAELADLVVPPKAWEGVRNWLELVAEPNSYYIGYMPGKRGACHHPNMTAVGMLASIYMSPHVMDAKLGGRAEILLSNPPKGKDIDYYYWYYGSLALFQCDGALNVWKEWNEALQGALLPLQNTEASGCKWGSWEPEGCTARQGGRVYATALNALTLEVYYRYPKVFTGSR